MNNCPNCQHELEFDGEQANAVKSTVSILASCVNPDCCSFESTFSHSERLMTPAELDKYAALRERLGISRK